MSPPFIRWMSFPNVTCFKFTHSPYYQMSHTALGILDDKASTFHPVVRQRERDCQRLNRIGAEEGLWLHLTGHTLGLSYKRVVRSWAKRRSRHAIEEQLKRRGYDMRGWPIAADEDAGDEGMVRPTVPLHGTLDIGVMPPGAIASYPQLQQQAGLLVNEVIRLCRRHQNQSSQSIKTIQPSNEPSSKQRVKQEG